MVKQSMKENYLTPKKMAVSLTGKQKFISKKMKATERIPGDIIEKIFHQTILMAAE